MSLANVGVADRIIRIIAGIALIAGPYVLTTLPIWDNDTLRVIIQVVGAILVFTGVVRFCGLYRLFGIKTN
ncbi:MAG: DUF2892 domain-containing protein [Granulosicoccus sp.]|nr:DUF2892 domain-containing protein [Granulosicoccus sp.]